MNGLQPHTGARLVEHKVAVHADAKVALGPLVRAVHAAATERGVPVATVLGDNPVAATAFARAERAVTARGDGATLRADAAGRAGEEEHRNGNWRQRRSCDGAGRKPDAAWRPTGPIARVAADAETSHLMRQRLQPGRIRSGPAFTLASVLVVGSAKRSLPGPDLGASGQSSSGASGSRSARRAPARSGRWKE